MISGLAARRSFAADFSDPSRHAAIVSFHRDGTAFSLAKFCAKESRYIFVTARLPLPLLNFRTGRYLIQLDGSSGFLGSLQLIGFPTITIPTAMEMVEIVIGTALAVSSVTAPCSISVHPSPNSIALAKPHHWQRSLRGIRYR